jgi:hypothetical protein
MGNVRLDLSPPPPKRHSRIPLLLLLGIFVAAAAVLGVVYSPFADKGSDPRPGSLTGLRFWSNGDSTSYYMSIALADALAARGAIPVQPEPEYVGASGLTSPDFFDWPSHIAEEMATQDPDIVVFMIGANDSVGLNDIESYRSTVAALIDVMADGKRYVYWVGQPNMADPEHAAAMRALNEVFRKEASKHERVRFVETYGLTSDTDGNYSASLPSASGKLVVARANDGVHITPDGGRLLADAVLEELLGQ